MPRRGQRAGELQTFRIGNCVVEKPFQRGGWVGKALKASPVQKAQTVASSVCDAARTAVPRLL